MRTILHSDLNSFYASVESVYRPELRDVPMAVCGDPDARHGIILTKNQLAKGFGIATGEPIWEAKRKCPHLVLIPTDMDKYVRYANWMRAIYADYTDQVEPFGMDEAWLDISGEDGPRTADEIRRRAREELGLTASIGVANNKIFAKLGSDMKKPDATTIITADNYREKVWPLPVGDLMYVGHSTLTKLHARGITTIGELARCKPAILSHIVGSAGETLHRFANGLDETPVARMGDELPAKSIGNSTTTSRDVVDNDDAKWVFMMLAELVGQRMREHGFKGSEVHIWVRDSEMLSYGHQMRLPHPTDLDGELLAAAMSLFTQSYGWLRPIRSVGLRVGKLTCANMPEQMTMFDDPLREKRRKVEQAIDALRSRFGDDCVRRAYLLADAQKNLAQPINKQYKPFECVRQG